MLQKTYEDLLAEGKTMDELSKTKEGTLELVKAYQNSFKVEFVYLPSTNIIKELVNEGVLRTKIVTGLTCYAPLQEESVEGQNGDD